MARTITAEEWDRIGRADAAEAAFYNHRDGCTYHCGASGRGTRNCRTGDRLWDAFIALRNLSHNR